MRSWSLISPEEVRRMIREILPPRREAQLPLPQLLGKVLSCDVKAAHAHPPFRQSSVDGYALGNLQETAYRLVGESRAGAPFLGPIAPGEAIRIFTGAAVPEPVVSVVMQEHTSVSDNQLTLSKSPVMGSFIREKGEQFAPGAPLLSVGQTLTPEHFGLLHGLGISSAKVFEPPKVHILVTGHEVVPFPKDLKQGQIWDENGPALMAYCQQQQLPSQLEYVDDDVHGIAKQLEKGFYADLLIITGGVSVGDYDHVPEALDKVGVKKCFHGVSQKPGKPFWMGQKGHTLVAALPGNPAAVMCIWHVYLHPLIQYFKGKTLVFPEEQAKTYRLGAQFTGEMSRTSYIRAHLQEKEVIPLPGQASYMLGGFIGANGLAVLPPGKLYWEAGDQVTFIPI